MRQGAALAKEQKSDTARNGAALAVETVQPSSRR